ncbi:unnamed protein product [Chondrus crispus]|uniref:Uncharacterized protein n=1 Tax=Chondrus crispus TaxID=2769 RepID=R7QN63_CHOCR|nr:unnamed protein product [Chondrus crispus]CDF39223.1 unnamed protein product [Chondrus crispus]|eukprot:XP_005719134.1 unnamed protein product [Chondrus crispus]
MECSASGENPGRHVGCAAQVAQETTAVDTTQTNGIDATVVSTRFGEHVRLPYMCKLHEGLRLVIGCLSV